MNISKTCLLLTSLCIIGSSEAATGQLLLNGLYYADKIVGAALIAGPCIKHALIQNSLQYSNKLDANENQQMRDMLHELCPLLKISADTIELRKEKVIGEMSLARARPALIGKNYILLSDEFFTLPTNQQKAVMAHELIHIKHKDPWFLGAFQTLLPFVTLGAFSKLAEYASSCITSSTVKFLINSLGTSWLIAYCATFFATGTTSSREIDKNGEAYVKHTQYAAPGVRLLIKLCQYQELRADLESAELAGTAEAAIETLKDKNNDDLDFTSPNEEHPSNKQRIEALKQFLPKKP